MSDNQLPDDEWDYYSGLPSPTWYERKANDNKEFDDDEWLKRVTPWYSKKLK